MLNTRDMLSKIYFRNIFSDIINFKSETQSGWTFNKNCWSSLTAHCCGYGWNFDEGCAFSWLEVNCLFYQINILCFWNSMKPIICCFLLWMNIYNINIRCFWNSMDAIILCSLPHIFILVFIFGFSYIMIDYWQYSVTWPWPPQCTN